MAHVLASQQTSLVFKVTKKNPELITPKGLTPCEFKELSDIDCQSVLRVLEPVIQFYRSGPSGLDPVKVIKESLGKALVAYYPLAGRLREMENGKLVVECNGEGVLFVEANADVTLEEFGEPLHPPFPCLEELFHEYHNIDAFLDYPLFVIQVTRLRCGGFVCAHKMNHTVADGTGYAQFMQAVAELARGAEFLSIDPIWDRHLLQARNPPRVTCLHREYDEVDTANGVLTPFNDTVDKSFFFGPTEIAAIKRFLPDNLQSTSPFGVVAACIWRSRTIALQLNSDTEVRLTFYANGRSKFNPPLLTGYYGNAAATPVAISTANDLISNPLGYAVEIIKIAKRIITEEYMKSLADFMVINNRPQFYIARSNYVVSDASRLGFDLCDFGWGNALYGGPTKVWFGGPTPGSGNYFLGGKNGMGESGIVVPLCLPRSAMDRFVQEIEGYLSGAVSKRPICYSRI